MNVHVADVRKPLLSVAEMNDAGHDVVFPADPSKEAYAYHSATGRTTRLIRNNNVFELDVEVINDLSTGGPRQAQP